MSASSESYPRLSFFTQRARAQEQFLFFSASGAFRVNAQLQRDDGREQHGRGDGRARPQAELISRAHFRLRPENTAEAASKTMRRTAGHRRVLPDQRKGNRLAMRRRGDGVEIVEVRKQIIERLGEHFHRRVFVSAPKSRMSLAKTPAI